MRGSDSIEGHEQMVDDDRDAVGGKKDHNDDLVSSRIAYDFCSRQERIIIVSKAINSFECCSFA